MWSHYSKSFCFRDCLDEGIVAANVAAIQKLLSSEQTNKNRGTLVVMGALSVSAIVDGFQAYRGEDDGTWSLQFYEGNKEVASVSLWNNKEIHLCFDIEKEVETGKFIIHHCGIKPFKEYQC